MYIKFLNTKKPIECTVVPNGNIVTLKFKDDVVVNTEGFRCYLDEKCEYDISGTSYEKFNTVYRNDDETAKYNGYQLSNDNSVWVKPKMKVNFYTNGGGTLEGEILQEVYNYEELVIPVPIASENYKFTAWNPEIPFSGEIKENKSYTAIFVSTLPPEPEPEPDPETTVEERVTTLEKDVQAINNVLGGGTIE